MNGSNTAELAPDLELDGWLERFESAAARGAAADPAEFLPDAKHPKYLSALRELLRLDLEFAWSRGNERRVEDYKSRFPSLFQHPAALADVALEEYRQRRAAGDTPDPSEYRERFAIDLPVDAPANELDCGPFWDGSRLPDVGEMIRPGYRVLAELGRGAFGRVYLAEQPELANRKVAIKISSRLVGEAQTLARLQHSHIVPVYAVHRVRGYQVLVMPYLGGATLKDVLKSSRDGRTNRETEPTVRTKVIPESEIPPSSEPGPARVCVGSARLTEHEVLEIGIAIADGLAHAHERGIFHRDVKPANILLTDDGEPMLLDFNLAANQQDAAPAAGGTPRYMAPEQFEALTDPAVRVGAPADVYALGVVLHELLTGSLPFPDRSGTWAEVGPAMLADRRRPPVVNYSSPAIASILRWCLQPDPRRRYASAAELRDDLTRHRDNQHLRVAPEPLSRERVRKWARRHPRLCSATSVASAAAVAFLFVVLAGFSLWRGNQNHRAREARAAVADAVHPVQVAIADPFGPDEFVREGRQKALDSLALYNLPADENWLQSVNVRRLPSADVGALREDVAQLLCWAAIATARLAGRETNPAARTALYDEALLLNARAMSAYPADEPAAWILSQRVQMLERSGRSDEAAATASGLKEAETPGPSGQFVQALADLQDRRYREAAATLEGLTTQGRASFRAWMALGNARTGLHQYASAADAFLVAGALEPESAKPIYFRALALLGAGRFEQSVAEFDRFIERTRGVPEAWLNRAQARYRLNESKVALADLKEADRLGASPTRVHGLYEMIWRAAGRPDEAAAAKRAMLAAKPRDVEDWTIRGEVQVASDPPAALADFDGALALDPNHVPALRGKASCLSEQLKRPADAVKVLDRLLQSGAATVEDRAGYAVLLARQGQAADARKQARACVGPDTAALPLYQAASALALTAESRADRAEVLALLRRVIQRDATWAKHMPTDPDLRPVHTEPDFAALMDAARVLNGPDQKDRER
jgi:eukaryotic-like serine/threonine-protein kinase